MNVPIAWFNLKEVKNHAAKLTDDLHRIKSGGTARGDKLISVGKRLDKTLEEAAVFETTHKLNLYKRAHLLSLVREGLSKRQWTTADIDAIVHQMLTHRLRKRSAP